MKALDELDAGDFEAAMGYACSALDGSARRAFPREGVYARFTRMLRDHGEVLERMGLPGLDVEKSRFGRSKTITWPGTVSDADVADVIYVVHRCCHAHGDEVPAKFQLVQADVASFQMGLQDDTVRLPTSVIVGILAVAVLSATSKGLAAIPPEYRLWWYPAAAHGAEWLQMPISEWWGREHDFLKVVENHPISRVTVDSKSDQWPVVVEPGGAKVVIYTVMNEDNHDPLVTRDD